jgi:IS30 family transposase
MDDEVRKAIIDLLKLNLDHGFTITADDGMEFEEHELIARTLKTHFYLSHPYAARERGQMKNEWLV